MLYEFNIMSTSLPDIKDPNLRPNYISKSSSLSFDVPSCPGNKRLKGINVTFKYTLSGDDWAWFCKISTANGIVDLMYNPRVFGKTWNDEVCIWLSYWPIGNALDVGATINVSIVVLNGLKVHECGASLVYSDQETMENNLGWEEILGGDLSGFKLSTGAYYLCRRDFFELMEVGRLTSDWFRILVGDTVDYAEVRGWRKTGRPKQVNDPSFTELRTVRCVIDGPQLDDIYKIPNYKHDDIYTIPNYMHETSSLLEGGMESRTKSDRYSHVSKTKHFTSSSSRRIPTSSSSYLINPPPLQIRMQQLPSLTPPPPLPSPLLPSPSIISTALRPNMMGEASRDPRTDYGSHIPAEEEEHKGPLEKIKSACSVM